MKGILGAMLVGAGLVGVIIFIQKDQTLFVMLSFLVFGGGFELVISDRINAMKEEIMEEISGR